MPMPTPAHAVLPSATLFAEQKIRKPTKSRSVDVGAPGRRDVILEVRYERLALECPHEGFGNSEAHDKHAECVNHSSKGSEGVRDC